MIISLILYFKDGEKDNWNYNIEEWKQEEARNEGLIEQGEREVASLNGIYDSWFQELQGARNEQEIAKRKYQQALDGATDYFEYPIKIQWDEYKLRVYLTDDEKESSDVGVKRGILGERMEEKRVRFKANVMNDFEKDGDGAFAIRYYDVNHPKYSEVMWKIDEWYFCTRDLGLGSNWELIPNDALYDLVDTDLRLVYANWEKLYRCKFTESEGRLISPVSENGYTIFVKFGNESNYPAEVLGEYEIDGETFETEKGEVRNFEEKEKLKKRYLSWN